MTELNFLDLPFFICFFFFVNIFNVNADLYLKEQ